VTLHLNSTGGLGNQLFQIAALLEAGDRLQVDKHMRFKSSGKTLRTFDSSDLLKSLGISLCTLRCKFEFHRNIYIQNEGDFQEFNSISDHTFMSGYFQNSDYNRNSRTKILNAIASNYKSCCENDQDISTVAIHLRIGDYALNKTNFKFHGVLSEKYYENAIELVEKTSKIENIYIFSDTPDQAQAKIENITSRINPRISVKFGACKNNNSICEMFRLGSFDNLVMSNSSFSWWAAALKIRNSTIGPTRWYRDDKLQSVNPMLKSWYKVDNYFEGEVNI
jgi:hypothetical protein